MDLHHGDTEDTEKKGCRKIPFNLMYSVGGFSSQSMAENRKNSVFSVPPW